MHSVAGGKLKMQNHNSKRKARAWLLVLLLILFSTGSVIYANKFNKQTWAYECDDSTGECTPGGAGGPIPPEALEVNFDDIAGQQGLVEAGLSTVGDILGTLTPWLFTFAGIALFVYLIMAGFSYLTSAGDPKKLESAKGKITAALIGFIVVFVAYWLVQIVAYIFGLEGLKGLFGVN